MKLSGVAILRMASAALGEESACKHVLERLVLVRIQLFLVRMLRS